MFTGIIMGQGVVMALQQDQNESRITLRALCPLPNIVVGESIAVNGACLTVENGTTQQFTAYASAETMACTTLGTLGVGSYVNLERALAVGDRLGGHIVSGHVDTKTKVLHVQNQGLSRCVRIALAPEHAAEVIPKGSVTLDGISLTVNYCEQDFLEVNVIPETWRVTTVAHWRAGTEINLETDVLGKYVRRMLGVYVGQSLGQGTSSLFGQEISSKTPAENTSLSLDFLRENGFA